MAVAWNANSAAYLLRRAGFGPTPAEVETFAALGHEQSVDRLVDYESIDNSALETRLTQLSLDLGEIVQRTNAEPRVVSPARVGPGATHGAIAGDRPRRRPGRHTLARLP